MTPRPKAARPAPQPIPKGALDKHGSAVKQAPKQRSSKAKWQRADVANTIAIRRHKGTPATLEIIAPDITGWESSTGEDDLPPKNRSR